MGSKRTLNILKILISTNRVNEGTNRLYILSYHSSHFVIFKQGMEPYYIKHQHQETANYLEHFARCHLAAHETQTLNTYMTKPMSF